LLSQGLSLPIKIERGVKPAPNSPNVPAERKVFIFSFSTDQVSLRETNQSFFIRQLADAWRVE
jgi:hypothetical protein